MLKIHVDLKNVPFERKDQRYQADLEIAGAVYDESGKLVGEVAGERAALNLTRRELRRAPWPRASSLQKSVPLPPGFYQVRLAAREASRSLLGSASQWVEIPDLEARPLTLSSVFLLADMAAPAAPARRARAGGGRSGRAVADVQLDKTLRARPGPALRRPRLHAGHGGVGAGDAPGADLAGQAARRRDAEARARGRARGPQLSSERIALDAFRPGDYELRVIATGPAADQKAERRVSFRVES